MRTKLRTAVMVTLAVTACSKKEEPSKDHAPGGAPGATAPAAAAAVDPCTMLTRDEAQEILGTPVDAGKRDEPVAGRIMACSYAASGESAYGIAIVQLHKETAASLDSDLENWKTAQAGPVEIERLEVAGVPAAWLPDSRDMRAFKSGWLVIASATKTRDARASAAAILEKVLPRLPAP